MVEGKVLHYSVANSGVKRKWMIPDPLQVAAPMRHPPWALPSDQAHLRN
jgi:hypothetical protein